MSEAAVHGYETVMASQMASLNCVRLDAGSGAGDGGFLVGFYKMPSSHVFHLSNKQRL